jgi:OOP family OmpA-OmpF porin
MKENAIKPSLLLRPLGLAALASLLAAPAVAQEGGYVYGGLSVGQSRARIDDERITANLLDAGLATRSMSLNESDAAFKLFGGYQFNRNWALEGGYFNLGKFGYTSTTVPAGTLHGQIKLQGLNLDVVGTLPLSERFSVIGRAGLQYAEARDSFTGTGAVQVLSRNPTKRDTNYKLGVGLQYEVNPSFFVRGEVERYRINDAVRNRGDINVFSVTLVFPLGRMPAPAPRAVEAYAAPEPTRVVVVPAPPVPAAMRRATFSADSLFGFDQSTLQLEGRAALDKFITEVQVGNFEQIRVEGHTDRLGSSLYNQKLSLRRAESVKGYLAQTGRIDPGKISTVSKGETEPVTKQADCKGNAPTPALIACLQPDRRVEVEVQMVR